MTRPKIILYNPHADFFSFPLALMAIGSALDADRFDVRIIDGRLDEEPITTITRYLDGAVCLGISVLTGAPIRDALRVSAAVKAIQPNLPVIWGGWHPSLFPTETLAEDSINITVQGQGETTFVELVNHLNDQKILVDLPGIAFRLAGDIIQNKPRPFTDMNLLPSMNYDLIPVEKYFRLKGVRQLDYISSTGCHFRCAFCADPYVYQRRWTGLAPERVGTELESLWGQYQFDDLAFQDETFFTHRNRAVKIAEEILQRGLKFTWTGTMRADQGMRLSEHELALCIDSGLRRVMIGVESGSPEMLRWMKKDITIDQVLTVAEKIARHRLGAIFPFIVGFPGESDESLWETLGLVKKLRSMNPNFETPIFYFKPYPGSEITRELVEKGFQLPTNLDEWSTFDFVDSPPGPWVTERKHQLIESFKFYNRFAWGLNTWPRRVVQRIARWRCQRDFYSYPIEKIIIEKLKPDPQLS